MMKTMITVCGICWKEDELPTTSNSTVEQQQADVEWLECEICGLWVHKSCTAIVDAIEQYICSNCFPSREI